MSGAHILIRTGFFAGFWTRRSSMAAQASFPVARWLAANPASNCEAVHISQPAQLAAWTKTSSASGGDSDSGGVSPGGSHGGSRFCYGDLSGLLPFVAPQLPASLDSPGFIAKGGDEDVGVEAVIRAAAAAAGGTPAVAAAGETASAIAKAAGAAGPAAAARPASASSTPASAAAARAAAACAGGAGVMVGGALSSSCDVLTYRNNLNKIFGTPFDPKGGWKVDACCLLPSGAAAPGNTRSGGSGSGGVLFLDIVKTEQPWSGDPANVERFTRWGYTFEALCTGQPVADSTTEHGILVRTRIAQHRLFIGAEMDCYDPASLPGSLPGSKQGQQQEQQQQHAQQQHAQQQQSQPGLQSYLELKTYRLPEHPGQYRTLYRWKHPKWWLQSFLAGVPRLALGARDDQGSLLKLDIVKTADLPRISAQHGASWSAAQALRFGQEVLGWMRRETAARPGQHLRFTYAGTDAGSRSGNSSSGDGSGSGSDISCEVLPDGQLPERVMRCLQECGMVV